jgi:hypothetical protein
MMSDNKMPLVKPWKHAGLDLGWIKGGPNHERWADAFALVWHDHPIYCAASVSVVDNEYYINTSAWHGMNNGDKEILENHLDSFSLTPLTR